MSYRLPIAGRSKCDAEWKTMTGDVRVRHCTACDQNVYNLTAMTREEVARLAAEIDGPCVRFYTRPDGTLITRDCAPPPPPHWLWTALQLAAALAIGGAAGAAVIPHLTPHREQDPIPWIDHKYLYTGKYEGLRLHCTRNDLPKEAKFE